MGANSASRVTTFKLYLWHSMSVVTMGLGKLNIDSNCICLLWYFQSFFKCQTLYHLNYRVTWFCYEWLLTLGRIITHLICVFAFDSKDCLLPGVMKFKSCLVLHDRGFVAHDFRQAQHKNYKYNNFGAFCETVFCLLRDLSVTNSDFEHARYTLPRCTLS